MHTNQGRKTARDIWSIRWGGHCIAVMVAKYLVGRLRAKFEVSSCFLRIIVWCFPETCINLGSSQNHSLCIHKQPALLRSNQIFNIHIPIPLTHNFGICKTKPRIESLNHEDHLPSNPDRCSQRFSYSRRNTSEGSSQANVRATVYRRSKKA